MPRSPNDQDIEFIFLGTGTSSSLPHVDCLTAPPDAKPCRTCLSTLKPEGRRNARRNTSALVRMNGKDGQPVTIVIDVGKTFQAAAVEWFPKYGLRRIDAVLITHAHADAMNGLDDLRAWTLRSAIQHHVDLYVSQTTFREIQRSFPYLVSRAFASGGGDVPEFEWHIIEDRVPFEIGNTGIEITPFAVHHGRLFAQAPLPGFIPTPNHPPSADCDSNANGHKPKPPSRALSPLSFTSASSKPPTVSSTRASSPEPPDDAARVRPLLCLGFRIADAVLYISDVSHIPDDVWPLLAPPPAVLALDCLHLDPHVSHFGLAQAVEAARRVGAKRNYLLGFGHEVSHEEYVTIGEVVGGRALGAEEEKRLSKVERTGVKMVREMGKSQPVWVRPAFDGLRIYVGPDGNVRDEGYD